MRRRLIILLALLLVVGGGLAFWWSHNQAPELTDRPLSEPLLLDNDEADATETKYCKPGPDGEYALSLTLEADRAEDHAWAEGGGCIERSAREVWGTLHNMELLVWDHVFEHTIEAETPTEGIDLLYRATYAVKSLMVTTEWTMVWAHTLLEGTRDNPKSVVVNYRRVSGSMNLPYWEGTILITSLGPELTGVTIRDQIRTMRLGDEDYENVRRTVSQRFDQLTTGEPVLAPLDSGD